MNYEVIIPAAGSGKRMGIGTNKLLLSFAGKTVIEHSLAVFLHHKKCQRIILVVNMDDWEQMKGITKSMQAKKEIFLVKGADERQFSVRNGLAEILPSTEIVLVHDGARPFIDEPEIDSLVEHAINHGASVLAVPVKDTTKKVANGFIVETINREALWSIQTPQAFKTEILHKAHQLAEREGFLGTDESSLVERIGQPVYITQGSYHNIKITTPEDIAIAEAIRRAVIPNYLKALLPISINEHPGLEKLEQLNSIEVERLLPELLTWLQDINWSIISGVQNVLRKHHRQLIPYIINILVGTDETWKYGVITLIRTLPVETASYFSPIIKRIAILPTESEKQKQLDELAKCLIIEFGW